MAVIADAILAELATSTANIMPGAGKGFVVPGGGDMYTDIGTAAATGGAATLDKMSGIITSEALTTAALASYTLTLTNSHVAAADLVLASVCNGTNSAGEPCIHRVTPASGSVVIVVKNAHATNAFNGTIKIGFVNFKA